MTKSVLSALTVAGLMLGAFGTGSIVASTAASAQTSMDQQYPACAKLTDQAEKQSCIEREKAKQQ